MVLQIQLSPIEARFLFENFGHYYIIFLKSSKGFQLFFIYRLIARLKEKIVL